MHDRAESEKRRRGYKKGKAKNSSPRTSQLSSEEVDDKAQQQRQQKHGKPRPFKCGRWVIPFFEQPFAEDPLSQVRREKFVAEGPGDVLVVRAIAANHQRNRGPNFRKRRV